MQGAVGGRRLHGAHVRSALSEPGKRFVRMRCTAPLRMQEAGLLGDTQKRDYTGKLKSFNAFAQPELREAIAALSVPAGWRVLDAGCGTGGAMGGWHASMRGRGGVVGM